MNIIKGTVDSKIVKLKKPDSIKYINNRETLGIVGGEFAITIDDDNLPITTLLGSCVAVMLYDDILRIKAMNHFLLPTSCVDGGSCRFGLYAMESMLNEMYKLGCKKEHLRAKIAGGANILHNLSENIGEKNVMFARSFCRSEKITIVAESVLGTNGRIIMLDNDFKTVTKPIANRAMDEHLARIDRELSASTNRADSAKIDNIVLF